jgi:uncharacterized protein
MRLVPPAPGWRDACPALGTHPSGRAEKVLNCPLDSPGREATIGGEQNQTIKRMDLHHPLLKEFPEHRETIQWLKVSDEAFRKKFDEYHQVDDKVYRIEELIDFATDQEIDELKMKRAQLKDQLYRQVRGPVAGPR